MKKREIKKVKSSTFGRGASLFQMTVQGSARWAGAKIQEAVQKESSGRMEAFFLSQAKILVKELGQLKGSVMKAGQMLSVYGEHFFPESINEVLRELHSQSDPVVWEEMQKVIKNELKETYDNYHIDSIPLAAASLGQVYKANREGFPPLALKVQYPGVSDAVDSDLKALRSILSVSRLLPSIEGVDDIFEEIRVMLKREVDYRKEVEMIDFYRSLLKEHPDYILPRVFGDFSTQKLLCMSYEEGYDLASPEVLALSQNAKNKLAYSLAWLTFKEIFDWRIVQTDPHFGNYKVRIFEDGTAKIVLLDFGAMRKFPKRYIQPFSKLIRAALYQDLEMNKKAAIKLGFVKEDDNPEVSQLMYKICSLAIEPFQKGLYKWGETDLLSRMTGLAKDAVFSFKLRPPPREAVFLDRKMIGMFMMFRHLNAEMDLHSMLEEALDNTDL
ncbi:MAG: ABC1 kinase family protein [Oligoflexales bacterium]